MKAGAASQSKAKRLLCVALVGQKGVKKRSRLMVEKIKCLPLGKTVKNALSSSESLIVSKQFLVKKGVKILLIVVHL